MTASHGRPLCYSSAPGTVNRSATVLRLPVANWLSSILVHTVLEIILREHLGFSVEVVVPSNSSTDRSDAGLKEDEYDIDLELWGMDAEIGANGQAVELLGPLGYLGRAGLFVNKRLPEVAPLSTFYRFWQESSSFRHLNVTTFGDVNLSLQHRLWVPSTCDTMPQQCAILLHGNLGYNEGYFERLVAHHNLSTVVGYTGRQTPQLAQELVANGKQTLFYWWEPDPFPDKVDAQRVSFPNSECVSGGTQDSAGAARCDFGAEALQKAMRASLRLAAPEALYAVSRMTISTEDIRGMFANTTDGGGSMNSFQAACAFVKAREDTLIAAMAPPCISSPSVNPGEGDMVFVRHAISCVPFLPGRETRSSSSCLNASAGTPDRSQTLVRLAWGGRLADEVTTAVLEIILKDIMRFDVWLVNVSDIPASQLGTQMETGLFDVGITTLEAGDLEAVSRDSAGPAGYTTRFSLFVLPHTRAKAHLADFWQFYAQGQGQGQGQGQLGLNPTDFYKYSDVDLRSMLGADFPVCAPANYSWCGAAGHEGFYVPPVCEDSPGDCLVVFAATPVLDTGYFEQVARNLGLPLVWAYLGEQRLSDFVRNVSASASVDATHKDLLFHADQLDLLPSTLGAARVAFPDDSQAQGCSAGYLPDPRNGTAACDHRPLNPVKLLREALWISQEIWIILTALSLSQQDMQQLLQLVPGGATRAHDHDRAHSAACDWVRNNLESLEKTVVPPCVSRPKATSEVRVGDDFLVHGICQRVACTAYQVVIFPEDTPVCHSCGSELLPNLNQTACVSCPIHSAPQMQASGRLECACNAGARLVPGSNSTECQLCSPGTFAVGPSRTEHTCSNCSAGTYSGAGSSACSVCPVGTAAASPGMSACAQCELDQFQETAGSTACNNCRPNMVTPERGTSNETLCSCKEGAFRTRPFYLCKPCPLGMICPAGSDLSLYFEWYGRGKHSDPMPPFPLLQAGYISSALDPLSVYQCSGEAKCPGGLPGTCGPDLRTDLPSCGQCKEGHYWQDGRCTRCPNSTIVLFPLTPLVLAPLVVALLYKTSRDETELWGSWKNCLAALGLLLLNTFQTISSVLRANLVYNDFTSSWFRVVAVTEDPMFVFTPQCAGIVNFRDALLMRTLIPLVLLGTVVFTHLASLALARLSGHLYLQMDRDRSANVYFALIFAFFPTLCSEAFTAFMCSQNPNGKSTLLADRSFHCYDRDWDELVVVAIFAMSYVVGFGALFCTVAFLAPRRFGQKEFQRRWKFLFVKFNPDVWWWSLCFCGKNLIANVGFTFIQSGYLQIYWVMLVTTSYCFGLFSYLPWRHRNAVSMDVCCCFIVSALASLVALVHATTDSVNRLEASLHSFIALLMFLPVVAGSYLVAAEIRSQQDVTQKAALEAEIRRRYKACTEIGSITEEQALRVVELIDDWGRWHMMASLRAISTEVNSKKVSISSIGHRIIDGRIRATLARGSVTVQPTVSDTESDHAQADHSLQYVGSDRDPPVRVHV